MKVLHIIPSYYPAFKYGGPIESVRSLNIALSKQGVYVDVLTTNAGVKENAELVLNEWVLKDGVRIKYCPMYFYEHYTFSPTLLMDAIRISTTYDLVHITGFWNFPVLAGSLASMLSNSPYVISPRGALYEDAINIKSKAIKKMYYFLLARHYLQQANAVHFTTDDEKSNVARFIRLPAKTFIVPNGLDITKFSNLPQKNLFRNKHSIPVDKKLILYMGRIHKQKGLELLIDAFARLSRFYSNLHLAIVGPGDFKYVNKLQTKSSANEITDKVSFIGLLSGEDKLSAFADADIFVLPSYFENFGMSVTEAMICGVPVVISDKVGISGDIQRNFAGVVVNLTEDSLCEGIRSLLENTSMRNQIAEKGKQFASNSYNIQVVAERMLDVYKEVLKP